MMKRSITLILIVSLLSCSDKPGTSSDTFEDNPTGKNLDRYFTALTDLKKFNGVLLALRNDSILLNKAYNLHSSTDSSTYVTIHTQFDIHSVSKLMAHYLVVKLESEGRLSKKQTVDAFIPDFPNGDQITLEMLLEHRSGLPRELLDVEGDEIDLSAEDIMEYAKKQPLLFEPGENEQYSNVGYELVYHILSKTYQKPFAQCVADEIFVPLSMHESGAHFFISEKHIKSLANNHSLKDTTIVQVSNILSDELKTARLFSTATDLNKFIDAVRKEPYATTLKNEEGVIAKDGGSKGIRAQVYTDLERNISFVLLCNFDEIPFSKTIEDVIKILKQEPFEMPKALNRKAIILKKETLEKYVGSYSFADFDGLVLEIKTDAGQLVVYQEGEKVGTLYAESDSVFFEDPKAPESFEFTQNESGTYDALMGWKGIVVKGKRN